MSYDKKSWKISKSVELTFVVNKHFSGTTTEYMKPKKMEYE